jgi:hypothetical protein
VLTALSPADFNEDVLQELISIPPQLAVQNARVNRLDIMVTRHPCLQSFVCFSAAVPVVLFLCLLFCDVQAPLPTSCLCALQIPWTNMSHEPMVFTIDSVVIELSEPQNLKPMPRTWTK